MNGQPDRRPAGQRPFDPMPDMRRKLDIVARTQTPRRGFAFDQELRGALQEDHPLGPDLVVPEASRTRLPGRNDSLDNGARPIGEDRDLLFGRDAGTLAKMFPL
jgi:hypothetical protein